MVKVAKYFIRQYLLIVDYITKLTISVSWGYKNISSNKVKHIWIGFQWKFTCIIYIKISLEQFFCLHAKSIFYYLVHWAFWALALLITSVI